MKTKNVLLILTACSYIRLYFSQDWLSILAAAVITIASVVYIYRR